ncbi:MAG: NAD(P)-dependent alcohol dehydrogenase [Chloroflexota bacterium]
MKAFVRDRYGPPDVLKLEEVQKPTPEENQVLVKVHAASVNPLDWHLLRADPFLVRLQMGFLKPKHKRLGADIAGQVEAVGNGVKDFRPGDDVYGDVSVGGFSEYISVAEDKLAPKPANLSYVETAAVPVAALSALQSLRDYGHVQPSQNVLINGASGGVGTFTVQIAKSFGAKVTGVCSTRNMELVRSLGADHVVDYTREDFTRNGIQYDLIIDNVGNRSVADYQRSLTADGACAIVGFTSMMRLLQVLSLGAWVSKRGSQTIRMMSAKVDKRDLLFINELLEAGKVIPVIDREYPFSEVPEALSYLERGRAQGKVVIRI